MIEIKNITWTTENFTILDNITFNIRGSKLTAIMGSSGAGKTSILNVISGRLPEKFFTGKLNFRDKKTSYVYQEDVLPVFLTVEEYFNFVKQSKSLNVDVKQTLKEFELCNNKKALINVPGQGISGGQRKKVSIALATMSEPSVIFLDEPTTGLDTLSAYSVVQKLENLKNKGSTVIATIHQPCTKILNRFDDLILMHEGKVLYFGPLKEDRGYKCEVYGNKGLEEYLKTLGFFYDKEEYGNIIDFVFMAVLPFLKYDKESCCFYNTNNNTVSNINNNINNREYNEEERIKIVIDDCKESVKDNALQDLNNIAETLTDNINNTNNIINNSNININSNIEEFEKEVDLTKEFNLNNKDNNNEENINNKDNISSETEKPVNFVKEKIKTSNTSQIKQLLKIQTKVLIRRPIFLFSRLAQAIITAILIGPVFWDIESKKSNTPIFENNVKGFLYQMTLNNFYSIAFSSIPIFLEDESLLKRELDNRMYHLKNFYISKLIIQYMLTLPLPLITPLLLLFYTRLSLGFEKFSVFLLANILNGLVAFSYAVLLGASIGNNVVATVVCSLVLLPLATVTGIMADPKSLPRGFSLIQYISPTRYIFNIQIKSFFKDYELSKESSVYNLYDGFVGVFASFVVLMIMCAIFLCTGYWTLRRRVKNFRMV